MLNEDLTDQYNSVCEQNKIIKKQRDKAVEKANDILAEKACLEIEVAGLRQELKQAYQEISKLKHDHI